jgi:hypothetical protein
MEMSIHLHAPAALFPVKGSRFPLDRMLGWPKTGPDAMATGKYPSPAENWVPVVGGVVTIVTGPILLLYLFIYICSLSNDALLVTKII